jgi:Fe-S cluster biogenesis protein NfuA
MTVREQVETVLDGLRQGFKEDGADLQVGDASDSAITISLIGSDETCWECIIPPDQLRNVVTSMVKDAVPGVSHIDFIDPRSETWAH